MKLKYASFSIVGKRENNEDFHHVFHLNASSYGFVVCDGVGGHQFGEVASKTVALSIEDFFSKHRDSEFNTATIRESVLWAQQKLKEVAEKHSSKDMACTLCFLAVSGRRAYLCWAGDSRIYFWNEQQKVFQTKDHSYVNWLIDIGEITKEEALTHPKKNVITRSLNPIRDPDPEIKSFSLKGKNYFLICTDGVLEAVDENELNTIWEQHSSIEDALSFIKTACEKKSSDNATAILVQAEYSSDFWSVIFDKFERFFILIIIIGIIFRFKFI